MTVAVARDNAEHILANVAMEPNSGCWLWLGTLTLSGYGRIWRPQPPHNLPAHRVSYRVFKGDPGDLCVCHSCDVRSCVNPDHLWLGTHADNMADRVAKGGKKPRRVANPPRYSTRHHRAKLTDEQVRFIRSRPPVPIRQLAIRFGVSHATVSKVANGHSYRIV